MSDLISRQAAIDAFKPYADYESNRTNADWVRRIELVLHDLPSAQPEKRTDKCTEMHACDCISRQAVLKAINNMVKECDSVYVTSALRNLGTIVADLPSARSEPSQVARDIATILENEKDMRVIADLSEYSDKLWKAAYERGKAEAQQKWIPCSERLPEDGQDVLFCDIDEDIMLGYHVKGRPDTHFTQCGSWDEIKNVFAWMPLPEPYAERRTDDR